MVELGVNPSQAAAKPPGLYCLLEYKKSSHKVVDVFLSIWRSIRVNF